MRPIVFTRREMARGITFRVNIRAPFGVLQWRRHVAVWLITVAAKILGVRLEITGLENEHP